MNFPVKTIHANSRFPHGSGRTFLALGQDGKYAIVFKVKLSIYFIFYGRYVISGGADATIKLYERAKLDAFIVTDDLADSSKNDEMDTQLLEDLTKELPIEKSIELHERPITCLSANHVNRT